MTRVKLYCLPYAGGTAMLYNSWKRKLSDFIEVVPVELSGRGKRFSSPLYVDMGEAVDDILQFIRSDLKNDKFAFFGHSMGALISYEVLYKLTVIDGRNPVHAFFSGKLPPNEVDLKKVIHTLPDEQFIKEVIDLGGTRKEIFINRELKEIFLPILKSDFKLVETYRCSNKTEFDFDISIFSGNEDKITKSSKLYGWEKLTKKNCDFYEILGGHFFIHDEAEKVIDIINKTLAPFQ